MRKIGFLIYLLIKFIDKYFLFFSQRKLFSALKFIFEEKSYKSINILNKKLNFFTPNELVEWRTDTILTKEKDTINWINNFSNQPGKVFWDIGANIGIYSIYASQKHNNLSVFAFEPSTSNLRTLSRNISLNNFNERIKICPFALTNIENDFLSIKESSFLEGGALNSFGVDYDYKGEKFNYKNSYYTFGTTADYLLKNKILQVPNYVKIDVDGIEHLIMRGMAENLLNNSSVEQILVELNTEFHEQFNICIDLLEKANFKLINKVNSLDSDNKSFNTVKNYIFFKKHE